MQRLNRIAAGPLLIAYLCACSSDVVGLPHGAVRWTPPQRFVAWWQLTEACSGLTGNYSAVRWYVVPNTDTFTLEGATVNGAWYGAGNRIVLGDSETLDGTLVRHEMLHALLRSGAHPRDQFLGRCGDIVVCVDRCVADAGGPPDTSGGAPIDSAKAFIPSTLVVPNPTSLAVTGGWFTVIVALTNPLPRAARLAVPDTTYGGLPITLVAIRVGPTIPGLGNGFYLGDQFDNYFTFAPAGTVGATRRVVFDAQLTPVGGSSETFSVKDTFASLAGPTVLLSVTP